MIGIDIKTCCLIAVVCFVALSIPIFGQKTESIRMPSNDNTCNVVNVNFGVGVSSSQEDVRAPGPPGKRGPVGRIGPKGLKGDIGPKGERGERIDVGNLKREIAGMLSVKRCEDLSQIHGVDVSGYYLMMGNPLSVDSRNPVYIYCDFKIYEGISTCDELATNHNIRKPGYYRLRDRSGNVAFHDCPTTFTCDQLLQRDGARESGLYRLGSEGNTFEVYCNFSSGKALTEVWHDSMEEIKVSPACEDHGCYSRIPQYKIALNHIVKIIINSRECRQHIKLRCAGVVLLYNNIPRGWWVSRGGEKMLYWGGAMSRRPGYCACGETGSCLNKGYKCNCDNNANDVTTQDEGYLTDKNKLPVREMKFGDNGDNGENAWHTLGKLECTGQA